MSGSAHPIASFGDILWAQRKHASQSLLNDPHLELTYNGRGALLRACTEIASRGKPNILLPAYHCPSGITPAIHAGLQPVFYRVRRDLSIDLDDLYRKADAKTAAVLVIHYFGVATDLQPLQTLRERGVQVIEDWSHSFLQGSPPRLAGGDSDYRIYSFWKLIPSMVGGGLWRRLPNKQAISSPMHASPLRERAVRLKRMFEDALNHSEYTRAKALFARFEALRVAGRPTARAATSDPKYTIPNGESHYPFDLTLAKSRMPWLARRILESSDFYRVVQQRCTNFSHYGRLLGGTDQFQILYPVLPTNTCPWVFPVLLKNRNQIDHQWRSAGVALYTFGIYLHSALFKETDTDTIADAVYLSEHLLCLAIHQDIGVEQVAHSAATIGNYLAEVAAQP